ncbi:head-tail connector protein [Christensenellaceae bacterium 44-20]
MELLEELKTTLRIGNNRFDESELVPLINACKMDMKISGVETVQEEDALVRQAIKLYAKAYFGYYDDNEKYKIAYEGLRDAMALSGDYRRQDAV